MDEFSRTVAEHGMDHALLGVIQDLASRRDARKDLAKDAALQEPDCGACKHQSQMAEKYGRTVSAVKDLRRALAEDER